MLGRNLCNHCDESHQSRVQNSASLSCGMRISGDELNGSPRANRTKVVNVRKKPKSLDLDPADYHSRSGDEMKENHARSGEGGAGDGSPQPNCIICRTECGPWKVCQEPGATHRWGAAASKNDKANGEARNSQQRPKTPSSPRTKTEVPDGPPERCRIPVEEEARRGGMVFVPEEKRKRISNASGAGQQRSRKTLTLPSLFPFFFIALMFLSSGIVNFGSLLGRGAIVVAGNEIRANSGLSVAQERGVCQSMDIRNSPDALAALKDCRVIEGFLQIILIDKYEPGSYDNHTYPLLTEITGFLLVFRVNGLTSLGRLFPNLAVIRGNELFLDYALVIYEVFHLEEIGLNSLLYIGRGAVRFEKNPLLCFTESVDWTRIENGTLHDVNKFKYNRKENECPVCPGGNSTDTRACPMLQTGTRKKHLCWNVNNCQNICPPQCKYNCDALGNCCDESCLGGCSVGNKRNCTVCSKLSLGDRPDRKCVDSCPMDYYMHMNRRCITKQECLSIPKPIGMNADAPEKPYIPFEYELNNTRVAICMLNCPKDYEFQADRRSCKPCPNRQCKKYCDGAKIDSISAAQRMDGCDIVTGTLEIQIRREGGHSIVKELEKFLSNIEEIYGELKIARSDPFLSLGFLKNLKTIRGLDRNSNPLENSLVLLDNENLEDLWNEGQRVEITSGKLLFHNNPKLCLNKIARLESMVSPSAKFNLEEFAKNSNGDRTACNVTNIEVKVDQIMPRAATISWKPVIMDDARSLIGYVIYYKQARFQNVTMLDGRDACGYDGWQNDDVVAKTNNFLFTHLEPFTQYAFYVKTYQIAVEKTGGQSEIKYFTTEPSQPEIIRNLRVAKAGAHEVTFEWDPPKRANGNLTVYIITCNLTVDNDSLLSLRDYCQEKWDPSANLPPPGTVVPVTPAVPDKQNPLDNPECDCDKGTNLDSHMEAENQINFEDALHNRVYVKRSQSPPPASQLRRRRSLDSTMMMGVSSGDNSTIATPPVIFFPKDNPQTEAPQTLRQSIKHDRYYTYIYREVAVPTTTVRLTDLKHYSGYTISIIACRSGPVSNNCSEDVIYTHRTDALPGGDDITNVELTPNPRNGSQNSVALSWQPPKDPNSLVLAYTIRYRNTIIEHSFPVSTCITAKVFNANNGVYNLKLGTENGNYSIQVQASSLGGFGNFTEPIYHQIENTNYTGWLIAGGLLLIFALCLILAYCYYQNKKNEKDHRLFAEVNADYDATPYIPDEYEIDRPRVKRNKELGQGSFGMVYAGSVQLEENNPAETPCAIKTVNDSATERERMNFLKEANVMKAFHTKHVVRLLGVVSKGDPPLVVMELMALGDLKGYLRAHRPDGEIGPDGEPPVPPSVRQILQMAIEIADGMAYLSMKKFVHRDLAARNCMVAGDLTVKIGDFGMTRDIYETDYYRKGDKGLLPVRWMSPESLKDGVFTSSNDVFSYGVVLWEMATLASQPYQGLSNDQVLRYVIDGGVMERPENCPDKLYALMRRCWEHRPSNRPTFLDIVDLLMPDVGHDFMVESFYNSPEADNHRMAMQHNDNHHPDEGTTLLRSENEMSHDNTRENFYSDMPNNNNNSRRLLEEAGGGAMPIIKPAQSPLRFLHGKSDGHDYKESKF